MENGRYTVFYHKENTPDRQEELRVDTPYEDYYKQAMDYAKQHNIEITRVYLPKTTLEQPNFYNLINQ